MGFGRSEKPEAAIGEPQYNEPDEQEGMEEYGRPRVAAVVGEKRLLWRHHPFTVW